MPKEDFDIKAEYTKLKNKYKELPSFEDINNDFELFVIDKQGIITRQIRRRIHERIVFFCRIIESIVYPNIQSTINAYEAGFFSEDEKELLIELHKRLMIFDRQSIALDIDTNENKDIEYVLKVLKEWPNLKKELQDIANKMENAWKEKLKEESERYFG